MDPAKEFDAVEHCVGNVPGVASWRQELGEEIAVGGVQLNHLEAGHRRVMCTQRKVVDDPVEFFVGHCARADELTRRLDRRRGHGVPPDLDTQRLFAEMSELARR